MNKEIKFRGYLKDGFFKGHEEHPSYEPLLDNRIVKIHSIHFNSKKVIISCPTGGNMSVEFKDIELMQYTGLKDKNGVEIYEGDIVKNLINTFSIIYKKGCFFAVGINKSQVYTLFEEFEMCNKASVNLKVIGNIYEGSDDLLIK